MSQEVWRLVTLPGLSAYEASSLGRIRGPRGILTGSLRSDGYRIYGLHGRRRELGHRLVFSAFHGDPEGLDVHHKDEDRSNNRPGNLQTLTKADHRRHHAPRRFSEAELAERDRKRSREEWRRRKGLYEIRRDCEECGEPFTTHRANRRFCAKPCQDVARNRRRREQRISS